MLFAGMRQIRGCKLVRHLRALDIDRKLSPHGPPGIALLAHPVENEACFFRGNNPVRELPNRHLFNGLFLGVVGLQVR